MIVAVVLLAVAALVATGAALHYARVAAAAERTSRAARTPVVREPNPTPAAPEVAAADAGPDATEDAALLGRLRQAVDQLEHGVVVWDARGGELFRNRAARSLAEARDGRVLVAAATEELLGQAVAGHTVRRVVELFGPPAESFVVSAYPFTDGSSEGALAVVEDRSLQRRTETVRRDFVANISHELKTPIGALGLLAETIRDEPDRGIVERLSERMILEADRVSRTVDDLLELSRIEFGDDAEFEEVSVSSVVGEAEGRIASAAENAGIKVRTDIPTSLHTQGDRRQLVSALFNLLDNAVKYSSEDSEVVVEAVDDAPAGVVRIYVSDSGVGVPRRDLDRIFERFYRVDRARSRETGGTGLGLAIVRHVASNHGGDVSVESTEGVGSTFTLTLPRWGGASEPRPIGDGPGLTPLPTDVGG